MHSSEIIASAVYNAKEMKKQTEAGNMMLASIHACAAAIHVEDMARYIVELEDLLSNAGIDAPEYKQSKD